MKAFAANGQSLMDTVSITGTAEMAMANVYRALIQPLAQPPVRYQVGWNSPQVVGERLDLLLRVAGTPGEPFGVIVQPLADPVGPLPLASTDLAVVCEP